MTVSVYTLGCKLNQVESESIADAFAKAGFAVLPFDEDAPADLCIINTCTVTSKAEQKARRIIRKLARNGSCVAVSGCYAQLEAEAIAALGGGSGGRVFVVAGRRKHRLLDLPAALARDGGIAGVPYTVSPLGTLPGADTGPEADPADAAAVVPALGDPPVGEGDNTGVRGNGDTGRLAARLALWAGEGEHIPHRAGSGSPAGGTRNPTLEQRSGISAGREAAGDAAGAGGNAGTGDTDSGNADADTFRFSPTDFTFHSRASLKIQDGCDRRCSYCRVSIARGPSVSLEANRALSLLKALENRGYNEAVLTGVNLNQYRGSVMASGTVTSSAGDTAGASGSAFRALRQGELGLAGLLDYLLSNTNRIRLRLSSLEPESITPELAAVLANGRVCPHFHLSVQSGSDAVLERMQRPYKIACVEKAAAILRSVKDDPFLACDIIAGFPGETVAFFEETYNLCKRIGFAWIHAFPYSPRPGTEAYAFSGKAGEREVSARVERLLALAKDGRRAYIGRQIGKTTAAIVERLEAGGGVGVNCGAGVGADGGAADNAAAAWVPAVSENYLKLRVMLPSDAPAGETAAPGSLVRCRIAGFVAEEGGLPQAEGFDADAEIIISRCQ